MSRLRKHRRIILLGCVTAVVAALLWPRLPRVATRALASAEQFELLSLAPERSDPPAADDFHRHRVLGRTTVIDPADRRRLVNALAAGVASPFASAPKCFNPRHGLRVTSAGQTTDFVICFECAQAMIWQRGRVVADWLTDRTPAAAFDRVLRRAGVPLAPAD